MRGSVFNLRLLEETVNNRRQLESEVIEGKILGGEGRNRTDECSFCRAVPYHLATPPPKNPRQYGCSPSSQVKLPQRRFPAIDLLFDFAFEPREAVEHGLDLVDFVLGVGRPPLVVMDLAGERVPLVPEADEEVEYGAVMAAMDQLRQAGIEDIGLITERKKGAEGAGGK